jgi:hypothetical protein
MCYASVHVTIRVVIGSAVRTLAFWYLCLHPASSTHTPQNDQTCMIQVTIPQPSIACPATGAAAAYVASAVVIATVATASAQVMPKMRAEG